MDVTIAICTWNRADLLDQTLAQMHHLRVPAGLQWELLVVNNSSTDHTEDVIAKHIGTLPLVRLFESRQGHSYARNCAIDAARGEVLIWTDDDVLVDEDWLANYVEAAKAWPEATYFGGPIDPWFECDPPRWMSRHWEQIRRVFVIRDYGSDVRPMQDLEDPAGANMAFRTNILRANRFDERLGRVGAMLTGADDSNIVTRLRSAGQLGLWVGSARVKHFLPADRLTLRYIADWHQGAGRTEIRQNGLAPARQLLGAPRWAAVKLVQARLKAWTFAPLRNATWYEAFREAAILDGYIREAREPKSNGDQGNTVAEPYRTKSRFPNLFIIGAMKAGTSSLHEYLHQHPDIFMARFKEPQFFAPHATRWGQMWGQRQPFPEPGDEWYLRLFGDAGNVKYAGESSVSYSARPWVVDCEKRIHAFNPEARIIYLMRDPVERAISHYWHFVADGREDRNMLSAMQRQTEYVARSDYAMQLRPYFDVFGAEQVFVGVLEELNARPAEFFRRLFEWLGVDRNVLIDVGQRHNVSPEVFWKTRRGLTKVDTMLKHWRWRQISHRLPPAVPAVLDRIAHRQVVRANVEVGPAVEYLRTRLKGPLDELRNMLGRDFPEWNLLADRAPTGHSTTITPIGSPAFPA